MRASSTYFKAFCYLLCTLWTATGMAQLVTGLVLDASGDQPLVSATVSSREGAAVSITDLDGRFSLDVASDLKAITLLISYVGYGSEELSISLPQNQPVTVRLSSGVELNELVVSANSNTERMRSTQMSMERVDAREAKLIPALLGESDILKTIQLKPGIPSGGEGTTGIYVRGGGADQNLFLLDGAVVYNPSHLFGFFSTFNTDAVESLTLYKGGFPAQYGGRLSSVIDVQGRSGNPDKFSGSGGIGLISSRLTLEGPAGDKVNYLVSGRRTYVDLITNAVNKAQEDNEDFNAIPAYNFYDLNAKVDFELGEKDRLFLSGYFGRDQFGFDNDNFDFGFNWGNIVGSLRWNHAFSDKVYVNTTAVFSDYDYVVSNTIPGFTFEVGSAIRDIGLRHDYTLELGENHLLSFGASLIGHDFSVGRLKAGIDDGDINFAAGNDYNGLEYGVYMGDLWNATDKLKLEGGIRVSGFTNDGKTYIRPEPRIAANYQVSERANVKSSYARMYQYVHLVSSAGIALPTDLWYPSTAGVKPQRSDQVAVGFNYLLNKQLLATVEVYGKKLTNQIDFVDGAELFVNDNLEDDFDFGRGYAYGFEAQLEKAAGKLTGWIGYTYQRSRRGDFPNIMQGRYFSPRFDRRHDVSVVGIYDVSKRWTLSATWVYGSGDLYWLPIGRKLEQGAAGGDVRSILPVYGDRNNYRLRAFHRGDIGAVYKLFPKWGESDITFSVFNVYDRRNAFFVYLDIDYQEVEDGANFIQIPERINPRQVSLFPILPSVAWNFKF